MGTTYVFPLMNSTAHTSIEYLANATDSSSSQVVLLLSFFPSFLHLAITLTDGHYRWQLKFRWHKPVVVCNSRPGWWFILVSIWQFVSSQQLQRQGFVPLLPLSHTLSRPAAHRDPPRQRQKRDFGRGTSGFKGRGSRPSRRFTNVNFDDVCVSRECNRPAAGGGVHQTVHIGTAGSSTSAVLHVRRCRIHVAML